ncbi:MAG: iron-sulfur cluster assembly scaffold protein [Alphaproteobacteria bacterium]|nr:iron-sulfur cluster assembly scaffold protein [Alphaproteobacteria bacterium]
MDTEQLYQDRILAFARAARQQTRLVDPGYSASVTNPSCGDQVQLDLELDAAGRITRIGAVATGCALCEAATGLLTETLVGVHRDDVMTMDTHLTRWLQGESDALCLDGQEAFTPVRDFTTRHGCVRLPFQAAAKAIKGTGCFIN